MKLAVSQQIKHISKATVLAFFFFRLLFISADNMEEKEARLFTVLYFPVKSSRSSALLFGLLSWCVSKLLRGQGAVWEEEL